MSRSRQSMKFCLSIVTGVLALIPLLSLPASAQDARITFPQDGQDVRGEITTRFEGIPDGGYAVVKVDGQFKTATAEPFYVINTFPPNFPADGPHTLAITTMNASGRQVGTSQVTFNIANTKVDITAPGVKLQHWTVKDFLSKEVLRFRIFAESNATIDDGTGGAGAAGAAGGSSIGASGGAPGADATAGYIAAPLDWQVTALVRRVIRDVGMLDGGANIRSVIDRSFQRQREGEGGGAAGSDGMSGSSSGAPAAMPVAAAKKPGAPANGNTKAPWSKDWTIAPETGQYFVKMILPTGEEINATRKNPSIALGDLLPTFPTGEVRPGSTWETAMTFVAELSARDPLNVRNAPMTFTSFETLPTPAGRQAKCAKLECRFRLPDEQAMEVAQKLAAKTGGAGAGAAGDSSGAPSGMAGPVAGASTADATAAPVEVKLARTNVSRVLWFDVDNRQVIRSEDIVNTYFEQEGGAAADSGVSGGMPGGPGDSGVAAAPAEPKKVSYNLRVTTWMDDRVPDPTDKFNGGRGTAHSKDSVQEPSLEKITRP